MLLRDEVDDSENDTDNDYGSEEFCDFWIVQELHHDGAPIRAGREPGSGLLQDVQFLFAATLGYFLNRRDVRVIV
jgi:hypothetical protein